MLHLLFSVTCTVITATVIGQLQKTTAAVEQKFRVTPRDVVVEEGRDVVLPCEVENKIGNVQWTKNGFALGYTFPTVRGFPTYTFAVNEARGVYNLEIRRATLHDDSVFECQVSPGMRANATLEVVAPPVSLAINDSSNGQKIRVRDQQTVTLRCVAKKSKPPATISWMRGNKNLTSGSRENKVIDCEQITETNVTKCDTSSAVTFQVVKADHAVNYTCIARTDKLTQKSLVTSVYFDVLYPSEEPYIKGYDGAVYVDKIIELICQARKGNPLAQLTWYKNGVSVQSVYRTFEERSECTYNVSANESENGANYTCEASSPAMLTSMTKHVILNVYFGPKEISMIGGYTGEAKKNVSLSCTTSSSYPPASIEWYVDGKSTKSTKNITNSGPFNAFITTSYLDLIIPVDKLEVTVMCQGFNPHSTNIVASKRTIQILHPPGKPVITGYISGGYIIAGSYRNLTCTSAGGNPLATLTWYKNGKKMQSATKTESLWASSVIQIKTDASDNGAKYKCEATNSATSSPLSITTELKVYFAPDNISIAVIPEIIKVGSKAELQCNSSSSNPTASVSWWRNGIPIEEDFAVQVFPDEYNGNHSRSKLIVNVTADMNRNVFSCQVKNAVLNSAIHKTITLNVLYKPVFSPLTQTEFEKTEGETFEISLQVDSNPYPITFSWMKDSNTLNHVRGSNLKIGKVNRSDAGLYVCTATNSEGFDIISFSLKVRYAAKIVNLPPYVTAKEGSSAQLNCTADGYPMTTSHIRWDRDNLKIWERVMYQFESNTSSLTIMSIKGTDAGYFYCIADNTIPPVDKKSVHLLIEGPPVVQVGMEKVVVILNDTARINCTASGVPAVQFTWKKNGSKILNSSKYTIRKQGDYQNHTSTLEIRSVTADDYGKYDCVVSNEYGNANQTYQLMVITKPEAPSDLELVNSSSGSITLRWKPKSDGGYPASFQIRYRILGDGEKHYKYEDVERNAVHTVKGLGAGSYEFDVAARNRNIANYHSDYSAPINVTVPGEAEKSTAASFGGGGILILTVAALIGVILILLNVFLILIFIFRRPKKKHEKVSDGISEHSSSKSRSIELFGSSSLNGTLSRGTPSSQSDEKSTSSSDVNRHFINEEINQQLPDVYLVEPVNCSIYRGDHILPPQARYNNIPYRYNNTYGRNTYAANQNGNDYTSLNRTHLRNNSTHNDAWQNTMLSTKNREPTYLTNHSDESSPALPPPMATFNYANFQERFLRI